MEESRNWLEIPDELMVDIFQRLPTLEILNSARKVCTTWLKICKYPAMWKVIDMHLWLYDCEETEMDCDVEALTKEAVDLSCGELIDIAIRDGTDHLLDYIVQRSSKLKRLCLVGCINITGNGLRLAVKRLPQLEEPDISFISVNREDIEFVGRNCPQLKSFIMDERYTRSFTYGDDHALAIANNMTQLSHLELSDCKMTNNGLQAILNGCPYLQSLDVRYCYNLKLNGELGKLCRERIKDFKCDADKFSSCYMDDAPYMDTFHDSVDNDYYDYSE